MLSIENHGISNNVVFPEGAKFSDLQNFKNRPVGVIVYDQENFYQLAAFGKFIYACGENNGYRDILTIDLKDRTSVRFYYARGKHPGHIGNSKPYLAVCHSNFDIFDLLQEKREFMGCLSDAFNSAINTLLNSRSQKKEKILWK